MIRGERFRLDVDDVDDGALREKADGISGIVSRPAGFVQDITERTSQPARKAEPPALKSMSSGFPSHKKRTGLSRFKQQRQEQDAVGTDRSRDLIVPEDGSSTSDWEAIEKERIDVENRARLSQMSSEEVEHERNELVDSLPPTLLERLLRRANIDAEPQELQFPSRSSEHTNYKLEPVHTSTSKRISFEEPHFGTELLDRSDGKGQGSFTLATPTLNDSSADTMHFPKPPVGPDLDPSSATFFDDLHQKYFPDLASDPSKLAWMTESEETSEKSPYAPDLDEVSVKAIRFSFNGKILPPRVAREIPVTKGLHHHGDAPESAGYTVPELAHLSRSTFPAQRCMSYAILGRLLFRLGKGEFGEQNDDLRQGLWKSVEEGRIIDTLHEESTKQGGHISAKAYATEALWLWQKGRQSTRTMQAA